MFTFKYHLSRRKSRAILTNFLAFWSILLNNAFKYSEPGTRIEVLAQLTEQELRISVKDEGQGILPEDLEKIFKRLYRVETSRNMKTGGHGLGLAIARELAHQLGGEITAESQ